MIFLENVTNVIKVGQNEMLYRLEVRMWWYVKTWIFFFLETSQNVTIFLENVTTLGQNVMFKRLVWSVNKYTLHLITGYCIWGCSKTILKMVPTVQFNCDMYYIPGTIFPVGKRCWNDLESTSISMLKWNWKLVVFANILPMRAWLSCS